VIAGVVAPGVVDLLEVVEVEQRETERRSVAAAARELALQGLAEVAAVVEAGERVADRLLAQAAFERLDLRDLDLQPPVGLAQPLLGAPPLGDLALALLVEARVLERDRRLRREGERRFRVRLGVEAGLALVQGEHAGAAAAEEQRHAQPGAHAGERVLGVREVRVGMVAEDVGDDDRPAGAQHFAVRAAGTVGGEAEAEEVLEVDVATADDHHAIALELLHRGGVVRHDVLELAQDGGQHFLQPQGRGERLGRRAQGVLLVARRALGAHQAVVLDRHRGDAREALEQLGRAVAVGEIGQLGARRIADGERAHRIRAVANLHRDRLGERRHGETCRRLGAPHRFDEQAHGAIGPVSEGGAAGRAALEEAVRGPQGTNRRAQDLGQDRRQRPPRHQAGERGVEAVEPAGAAFDAGREESVGPFVLSPRWGRSCLARGSGSACETSPSSPSLRSVKGVRCRSPEAVRQGRSRSTLPPDVSAAGENRYHRASAPQRRLSCALQSILGDCR
jgi:hypothetical protein